MSEVILSNIQIWRQKARDGTATPKDMREAIDAIRKERVLSSAVSTKSRATAATKAKAAKAAPINSDDLLGELGI